MYRVAPVAPHERIADIDVLRGFALLGVFLSNLVSFAGGSVMADSSQLATLPSAWWDALVNLGLGWLVDDKANTLFALLFGVGFAIQQQRAVRKGGDPDRLLSRRMLVLLSFGVLHLFFLWPWDVLHVYAQPYAPDGALLEVPKPDTINAFTAPVHAQLNKLVRRIRQGNERP